jgi:transcriptional regulator with XRE-family HTH domain
VGTQTWDHEAFYTFVIARAKNLGIADSTASLARAAGLTHSQLSKWFRGHERPRPDSLQKLATAVALPDERAKGETPYTQLLVLTGHLQQHQAGMAAPPTPPPVVERDPIVVELEQMLGGTSKLSEEERDVLRGLVDRVLAGWRPQRNGRRRTA